MEIAEKTSREANRVHSDLHEHVLNSLLELVVYQDANHRIQWANKAACNSVNKKLDQLIGKYCYDIWHSRDIPCENCPVAKTLRTGQPQNGEITSPDGRAWFIQGSPVLGEDNEIAGIVETTLEITDRKRVEEHLNLFKAVVASSEEAIAISNETGKIMYVNPAFEKLFGVFSENPSLTDFNKHFTSDSLEIIKQEIPAALNRGESWKGFLEVVDACENLIPVWNRTEAIRDSNGKILFFLTLLHDATELKNAENKLIIQKEEKALLLDILTHDLNNIHSATKAYIDISLQRTNTPEIARFLQKSRAGLVSANNLLSDISILLKRDLPSNPRLYPVKLQDAINVVERMLKDLYPARCIELSLENIGESSYVIGDSLFEQLLLNLLTNAVKNDQNPLITIKIRLEKVKAEKNCILSITDQGKGISPDNRERIFDRFSSFRKRGRGSGLGMFIVKTLVERYQGKIWIESRIAGDYTQGTRINVQLSCT
ncbi:MAG: ATP-binding protein [Candidatus Odinarchaeota archaeon]